MGGQAITDAMKVDAEKLQESLSRLMAKIDDASLGLMIGESIAYAKGQRQAPLQASLGRFVEEAFRAGELELAWICLYVGLLGGAEKQKELLMLLHGFIRSQVALGNISVNGEGESCG